MESDGEAGGHALAQACTHKDDGFQFAAFTAVAAFAVPGVSWVWARTSGSAALLRSGVQHHAQPRGKQQELNQ